MHIALVLLIGILGLIVVWVLVELALHVATSGDDNNDDKLSYEGGDTDDRV